jgi:fatty acid-binding protein DegV
MNAFMTGIGSLIQLKPILTMREGLPKTERVRTAQKAEARLVSMLEENMPIERFALLHTNAPDDAEAFYSRAAKLLPKERYYSMDITPVIGAHLGPGAVGFSIISKSSNNLERDKKS